MDSRFLSFVWRYSKRDQIIILVLTILSFPLVLWLRLGVLGVLLAQLGGAAAGAVGAQYATVALGVRRSASGVSAHRDPRRHREATSVLQE